MPIPRDTKSLANTKVLYTFGPYIACELHPIKRRKLFIRERNDLFPPSMDPHRPDLRHVLAWIDFYGAEVVLNRRYRNFIGVAVNWGRRWGKPGNATGLVDSCSKGRL